MTEEKQIQTAILMHEMFVDYPLLLPDPVRTKDLDDFGSVPTNYTLHIWVWVFNRKQGLVQIRMIIFPFSRGDESSSSVLLLVSDADDFEFEPQVTKIYYLGICSDVTGGNLSLCSMVFCSKVTVHTDHPTLAGLRTSSSFEPLYSVPVSYKWLVALH